MTPRKGPESGRAVARGVSQAHRKALRNRLGPLSCLRVAPGTRRRYAKAYAAFSSFVAARSITLRSIGDVDASLALYVESLWEEGEPKPNASDTVASLQYYLPSCKHRLPLSWSLIGAWGRHELPTRALPLTPDLLTAFCGGLLRANEPRLALAALFGFSVLARTGELLSLLRSQVYFESDTVIVNFHETKRGQRLGVDEGMVLKDPVTTLAVRALCHNLEPGDRLVNCSEQHLRAMWAKVTHALKLQHLAVRPYSLRRGGATHLFRRTGNLHAVAQAGRWSSLTTTRRYMSDTVAAVTALSFSG